MKWLKKKWGSWTVDEMDWFWLLIGICFGALMARILA